MTKSSTTNEPTASGGDDYFSHQHVTVIERRSRLRMFDLKEIWAYRELFWTLARRDITVRYKQTALGMLWAVLRPLLTVTIFSLVFGQLARLPSQGVPYPLFVLSGLLPWLFFSQAVSSASGSVLGAGPLVTKVYFPRILVPLASIGVAVVDFVVGATLLLPLMIWYGVTPSSSLVAVPFIAIAILAAAVGVGTFLAGVTVVFRDFRHVEPFVLQIMMFVTPVIYPVGSIPADWMWIADVNPLAGVVDGFRAALLGLAVDWERLSRSCLYCLTLVPLAVFQFERVERQFADVL